MYRVPRQVSSVQVPTTTLVGTTTSGISVGTTSQTPTSFSTGSTSVSGSAELTTLSSASSTETPSTSSHTSTSPSSSSAPSTTSLIPTSTPTSSSSSTSTSSSAPSLSLTTTASTSSQGTPTTITSAYTTYIDGSPVTTTTTIPSTIPDPSTPSSNNRTAIIAGSAAGATALLILILTLAFCIRRHRFKRLDFLDTITLRRKQARERLTFLDGEDLDDTGPRRYTDYDTPWDTRDPRSRWSESGSAFRENLWPPPLLHESTRLMDPDAGAGIGSDLSRIVDAVMGPSPTAAHYSDRSVSSMYMYRSSLAESASEGQGLLHSRTVSDASHAALLEAAGLTTSTSNVPVRSSPLAQQGSPDPPDASK